MVKLTLKKDAVSIADSKVTQWDYGQELKLVGNIDFTKCEVHFSTYKSNVALIVKATSDTVAIPDVILATMCAEKISVYVYEKQASSGTTIYEGIIYCNLREKPDDYPQEMWESINEWHHIIEEVKEDTAELSDIRVKADGTSAPSAGTAVREQISELKSDLDNSMKIYKQFETSNFMYVDGYMCTDGSTRNNKSGFKYTKYIFTKNATKITGYVGGFVGNTHTMAVLCFFDKSLNLLSVIPSESTAMQYFEATIPENAYYFWVSSNDNLGTGYYRLFYDYHTDIQNNIDDIETLKTNNLQNNIVPNLSVSNFLKNSGTVTIATWIDDDTVSQITGTTTNGIEKVKAICDEYGIKCTFGCITKVLEDTSVKNLLLDYQNEGFHITSHSKTHNATKWYGNSGNPTDIKACEIELVQSLVNMQKEGFLNSDEFIIPGGNQTDEEFFEMLARHAKNAVLAYQGGTTETSGNYYFGNGKYKIYRLFINSSKTIDNYKSAIDRAFRNGSWLVIGTHSGNDNEFNEQLLRDVLDYIKEKGIEFYTLHRAFEIRKPCYDAQAFFS